MTYPVDLEKTPGLTPPAICEIIREAPWGKSENSRPEIWEHENTKTTLATALLLATLLLPAKATGEEQTRIYDARGKSIGTLAPQGQGTVRYYDARGNSLGTSTTTGGVTKFYDARQCNRDDNRTSAIAWTAMREKRSAADRPAMPRHQRR